MHLFIFVSGVMPSPQHAFLLIACLLVLSIGKPRLSVSLVKLLIIPFSRFLGVHAGLIFVHTININSSFDLENVSFLVIAPFIKVTKCLHVPTNRVYISRDVIFDKHVFPFAHLSYTDSPSNSIHTQAGIDQFEEYTHAPSLLPNHGTGTGRGARLEILEQPPPSPSPESSPGTASVDH
jgi:hypothetical protein